MSQPAFLFGLAFGKRWAGSTNPCLVSSETSVDERQILQWCVPMAAIVLFACYREEKTCRMAWDRKAREGCDDRMSGTGETLVLPRLTAG
ncbi:hypothetical protein, partial [Pleomorphomonas koreensis]|uniref:hypothetical protein n=1 Tax=Pleomorphomonas koreensis TaxID=257440 RepID=UPI001AEBE5BD